MLKCLYGLAIATQLLSASASALPADASVAITSETAEQLQHGMIKGRLTSVHIVNAYLVRINQLDRHGPQLNSIIAINPEALSQARRLDADRRRGKIRGPLHGVPVLIKDNVETADSMATTAGSLALAANITHRDAPLVARLREAGAIILGKTNLSEWANFRSIHSISGWSAVGGIVRNPYARDRTACGSSSGSGAAVAAGLAPVAIGTETDGSVVCPASINGLVGVKPTLGLVSRTHIIPISHHQDTAGPLTTTVQDAAMLLTIIAGSDATDPDTKEADAHKRDYTAVLNGDVRGVRIGVLRDRVGDYPLITERFDAAIAKLQAAGAIIVEIKDSKINRGLGEAETSAMLSEFKAGLNAYLATTPVSVKARTLADLIAFNKTHSDTEMPLFRQELFEQAEATKGLNDPDYIAARDKATKIATVDGLDRLFKENELQILVQPTQGAAWLTDPVNGDAPFGPSASDLPAVAGYPHVSVPMGLVQGLPVGLSFIGPKWSEAALLNAAYAYEQRRGVFPRPTFGRSGKTIRAKGKS